MSPGSEIGHSFRSLSPNVDLKKRRMQVSQDIIEYLQIVSNFVALMIYWFFISSPNRSVSEVNGSLWHHRDRRKENKFKNQIHVDHGHQYEGHRPQKVLATGPVDQSNVLKDILQRMLHSVHKKRQELRHEKWWLLHYDNATSHCILIIRYFRPRGKSPN